MDNNQYKKEVNAFCDNNLKLTAQDILSARENGAKATVTDISSTASTRRRKVRIIPLVAAMTLIIGFTGVIAGAAGYGPLASLFSNRSAAEYADDSKGAHDDSISANLVASGYSMYIGQTQTVGDFEVTFEGVTGDWVNPQMAFTIRTDNQEFYESHDRLYMTVYKGTDEDAFGRRVDLVGIEVDNFYYFDTAIAYKSSEDPSVYILTYGVYQQYVNPGATIYTEVRSIRETADTYINYDREEIMLNCEFSFDIPGHVEELAPISVYAVNYDEASTFTATHDIEYHLTYVVFGQYSTEVEVEFYYGGTDLEYIDEDFWGNYETAEATFQDMTTDMRLVVDGIEYLPTELGGVYPEETGLRRGTVTFPEVNFIDSESISVIYNGQEINIK